MVKRAVPCSRKEMSSLFPLETDVSRDKCLRTGAAWVLAAGDCTESNLRLTLATNAMERLPKWNWLPERHQIEHEEPIQSDGTVRTRLWWKVASSPYRFRGNVH